MKKPRLKLVWWFYCPPCLNNSSTGSENIWTIQEIKSACCWAFELLLGLGWSWVFFLGTKKCVGFFYTEKNSVFFSPHSYIPKSFPHWISHKNICTSCKLQGFLIFPKKWVHWGMLSNPGKYSFVWRESVFSLNYPLGTMSKQGPIYTGGKCAWAQ